MINIPYELINIILEYDGRIKYRNGKYINVIDKNDCRYEILREVILYKIQIVSLTIVSDHIFYNIIYFTNKKYMGLCYDYNWSYTNTFEICLTTYNHDIGIKQIRTIIC
jgi:hypothetical protein